MREGILKELVNSNLFYEKKQKSNLYFKEKNWIFAFSYSC
jgi:hypothetical protein